MPVSAFGSALAMVFMLALGGCAATVPPPASAPVRPAAVRTAPPGLVVAISVDQFSADLFAQYRPHFTEGLARLAQGAVFPSAFQSHAATETCPGHATLLTGVHPSRNGIIANVWFDTALARADKRVYCAEDESDPASTSGNPVVSAIHLRAPTLGEFMKQANPASRNVAVAGKDRAAVVMGGNAVDEVYWYASGQFASFAGRPLHPAAQAANTALAGLRQTGAPALVVPGVCAARSAPVDTDPAAGGSGSFAIPAGDEKALRTSPRLDAATLELAAGLVTAMRLGRGAAPDLLSVSLSATDYIGHAAGHQGPEMCIQMMALDRVLGTFLAGLDAARIDYIVVLTADHGGLDTPERLSAQALPDATRADRSLRPAALGQAIREQLGLGAETPVVFGDGMAGDLYVNKALPGGVRTRAIGLLAARLRAHPQVAAAFTAEELLAAPLPAGNPQDWTLRERARARFDPQRSGDVVVLLDRAVVPIAAPAPGLVATHGSAWDYDRRVPLLFWRAGLRGFEQPAPIDTVDIAPTLAALLGLAVPDGSFDGRCLDLDGGAANTCAARR